MSTTRRVAGEKQGNGVGRTIAGRHIALREVGVLLGYGFLVWTLVIVLFLPNGWLPVWTATAATALLSFDRRLGPLPAAMLIMLALPVGRGAEVGLPRLPGTDIPVRAHDLVALVGVALAIPAMIRRLGRPHTIRWEAFVPVAAFLGMGIVALVIGVLGDQAMRDVIRDARWWAFYAIGLFAVLAGTSRSAVTRAVIWGLTIYCLVLLIGLLMPVFHGGLKWYAYSYDPRLRLHYGQATFLLVAIAYMAQRVARRLDWPLLALVMLLAAGVAVTLTRTLLLAAVGVAILASIAGAYEAMHPSRPRAIALLGGIVRRAAPVVLATGIGIAGGFGAYWAGVQIWQPLGAAASTGGEGSVPDAPPDSRPVLPSLNRILDDTVSTGIAAQSGGRLASYAYAFVDTAESPLLGHGMGQLARVPWAWGGFRAHTEGSQPGVDNAYLTVGLKAGALGIAVFAAMLLWPVRLAWGNRRLRAWFVPAWLAILGLALIQSFAVSGYAPFAIGLLLVLPTLGTRRMRQPD